jgi:hypothetical protein
MLRMSVSVANDALRRTAEVASAVGVSAGKVV